MNSSFSFIKTSRGISVFLDGKSHIVSADSPQHSNILAAIKENDVNKLRACFAIKQTVVAQSGGVIQLTGEGRLLYKGEPLHNSLSDRILDMFREGFDVTPLVKFAENLMSNPSRRAVTELYGFLEACDLPITPDGHFLAYKRVRDDYFDIHSGTIRNAVGDCPSMDRNFVDDDKDRTCSAGLHFCSKSYLPHFGSGPGSRVVVVKISPADVVSIPSDYNNAKGRACKYTVIGEIPTDEAGQLLRNLDSGYTTEWHDDSDDFDDDSDDFDDDSDDFDDSPAFVGVGSLSDDDVRSIRNCLKDGWTLSAIAKAFGTSSRTVGRIRDRETYTHVK